MNVKMFSKKMIFILLTIILIISINNIVEATESEAIEIKPEITKIEPGESVAVQVLLHNQTEGISTITGYFHYDSSIFEELESEDITVNVEEEQIDSILYNKTSGKITIYFIEDIKELNNFLTINLKIKEDIDINTIETMGFSLNAVELYCLDKDILIEDLNAEEELIIQSGIVKEDLYLLSETYKIGENNEYESEDKYITKVVKETTKEEFVQNIETNGEVRILKHDGTELGETELVGTGMILEVTKDDEKIELKIVVLGDLSGDGKVTATDLSTINQHILKLITLENEYFIAADLDENEKITVTDLSTINKMLLKLL